MDAPQPVATIFRRRIRTGSEPAYEEWLHGITECSSRFPGSQGTTILAPTPGHRDYVAVVQFDTVAHLDQWIESDERRDWLSKLEDIPVAHQEVHSLAGLERWLTLPGGDGPPPRYKTATLVFLGLYPTVLTLDFALGPVLDGLPAPAKILLSLLVSVPLMVWLVLPALTKVFAGWLSPGGTAAEKS